MYSSEKKTRLFDLEEQKELDAYDEILNNPLCRILKERPVKKKVCEFAEGQIVHSEDRVIIVVTWEEKQL